MNITVNGERREVPESANLADLVAALDLAGRRIAVELNENIVPRSLHAETLLHENDRVEIVHAIGGG